MVQPKHSIEQHDSTAEEEERDRRATNIFLLVFFVVIVGSGIWLVNAMIEQKAIDNCVGQGRHNCAPIETAR